jgi:hypothetical protein
MAIDEPTNQESLLKTEESHAIRFVVIFLVLAALVIGEIYTLHQFKAVRDSLQTQTGKTLRANTAEITDRFAALEHANNQKLEAIRQELEQATKRVGSTGKQFSRARAMVMQLQKEQVQQSEALKQEIARKADQQQFLALSQDVSSAKTDLDGTKKAVSSLTQDLGMARSELGTMIARNHDDIEQLRKMGERDYFEFTLNRNQLQHIGSVGLLLKRANVKRNRFTLALTADDITTEKKDRTVNEPVFFYVAGSKKPYELVVNKVEPHRVVGYISVPKGAVQMQVASREEGKS